jgi:spermidine synthase
VTWREESSIVARAVSGRGELVLRRRHDGSLELRVNGVFVMDDEEVSSERRLAEASLAATAEPRRVLVGGLGLGCTLAAVLEDPRVEHVTVVELEPALVEWLRADVVPGGAQLLAEPRVDVLVDDVAAVVADAGVAAYDVVLLDVDNGPDYLVHDGNVDLYREPFLRRCAATLSSRGVLVVWSMNESAALVHALRAVFPRVWTERCRVRLGERGTAYWLHLACAVPAAGH